MPLRPPAPACGLGRLLSLALLLLLPLTAVAVDAQPSQAGTAPEREAQLRFMWALAGQESGWDYYARNTASGAYGKYQIMPFNWPVWAQKYLGDRHADQTPWNQERVALGKLHDLHQWLGSWRRVAYWWLTGSSERNEKRWSSYARNYVDNIMALRKQAPAEGWEMPPRTSSKARKGDWRRSGREQRLRLAVGGSAWPVRGLLRDGQVLKVRASRRLPSGERWIQVLTADGRMGWLKQLGTVPAHAPAKPKRWRDVADRGSPPDRRVVRPRPR